MRTVGAERASALGNMFVKALSVPVEKAAKGLLVLVAPLILGEAGFGRFQFADTVSALLLLATDLGLGIWTTRALARSPERADEIVATGLGLKALVALPYLVLVGIVGLVLAPGETRVALLLLGVANLSAAFVEYCDAVFRGFERLRDEARLNVVRAVLMTAGGLTGLLVWRSLAALAVGLMLGAVASGAWGFVILRRRYRLGATLGGRSIRFAHFDRTLARGAVAEALPLWLATLLSMVYFKGDTVLLRAFAGDAAVGSYAVAYKVFEATMILPSIVLAATFPALVRAAQALPGAPVDDHAQVGPRRGPEIRLAAALLGLGVGVGAAIYAAAPLVRVVYGAEFGNVVPSLRVLCLAVPLVYLNYGLTHFLIARHLERRNLLFAALMVVLNVGVNLALIPRWGGPGAAWATFATEVGLTGCCAVALLLWPSQAPQPPPAPAAGKTAQTSA